MLVVSFLGAVRHRWAEKQALTIDGRQINSSPQFNRPCCSEGINSFDLSKIKALFLLALFDFCPVLPDCTTMLFLIAANFLTSEDHRLMNPIFELRSLRVIQNISKMHGYN